MSELLVNTIKKADGTGGLTIPADAGTVVTSDVSGNISPTGIYLGGTGSANYLDDYEEGTWTPAADAGLTSFTASSAIYIKVGSLVYVQGYFTALSGKNASALTISGLPFNPSSNAYAPGAMESTSAGRMGIVRTRVENTELVFYYADSSNATRANFLGTDLGDHLIFAVTYKTDS